jgi:hypothetical protein
MSDASVRSSSPGAQARGRENRRRLERRRRLQIPASEDDEPEDPVNNEGPDEGDDFQDAE